MSYKRGDRVLEVSTTTGTGALLLGGPENGYYTFGATFNPGDTFRYAVWNPITGENEVGLGTLVDNGGGSYSISRTLIERSSNANAAVNFAAGRKYIANGITAGEAPINADGSVAFTGDQSLGGHNLADVGAVNKVAITQPATGATLTLADGSSLITSGGNSVTITSTATTNVTLPSGTRTLVARDTTDTLTNKTLTSPTINTPSLNGSGGALTLPAGPTTLVGRDTTDTLTNKSIDASQLTGAINAARLPAFSGGDVTSSAGSAVLSIGSNKVTYTQMQQVAANSLIGNSTGSTANAGAVGLAANLRMNGGNIDCVQDIQTSSNPQFAALGLGAAAIASPMGATLEVKPRGSTNGIGVLRYSTGAVSASAWGILIQNPTATSAFQIMQNNSTGGNITAWVGASDPYVFYPSGNFGWGNTHPTIKLTSGNNLQLGGDSTSATLAGAAADVVSMASVDRINTRHAAAGNRVEAIQTERGSAIYVGDDAVDFAASTAIVSVGGSDVLSITSTGLAIGGSKKVGGTIKTITTTAGNTSTGETDLHSVTIAAGLLVNDGDAIRITQSWKTAGNSNNKTIKQKFGATTIIDTSVGAANACFATSITTIQRTSATTQICSFQFIPSVGSGWPTYGANVAAAETLSGSITLKATGTGGATNDITQVQTIVEYLPANP